MREGLENVVESCACRFFNIANLSKKTTTTSATSSDALSSTSRKRERQKRIQRLGIDDHDGSLNASKHAPSEVAIERWNESRDDQLDQSITPTPDSPELDGAVGNVSIGGGSHFGECGRLGLGSVRFSLQAAIDYRLAIVGRSGEHHVDYCDGECACASIERERVYRVLQKFRID